jgi:hypothetical protein
MNPGDELKSAARTLDQARDMESVVGGRFVGTWTLEQATHRMSGPVAPVRWLVNIGGIYVDDQASFVGPWAMVGERRAVVDRFAIGQLEPLRSEIGVAGMRGPDGSWSLAFVVPPGYTPTYAERVRVLRGLELLLPGKARRGRLEPEEFLGRLMAEDGGLNHPWWKLPVADLVAGEIALSRGVFYRYLDRFGWPLKGLRA